MQFSVHRAGGAGTRTAEEVLASCVVEGPTEDVGTPTVHPCQLCSRSLLLRTREVSCLLPVDPIHLIYM